MTKKNIVTLFCLICVFIVNSDNLFPMVGKVAYVYRSGSMHVLNLETGIENRFVRSSANDLMLSPNWNPDGTLIITDTELTIVNPETNERVFLRDNALEPSWNPSSNRIAYHTRYQGLAILDLDEGVETIIDLPVRAIFPNWHPIEDQLIFTGVFPGVTPRKERIFTLHLDCLQNEDCSQSLIEIDSEMNRRDASWSSTGDHIILLEEYKIAKYRTMIVDNSGEIIRYIQDENNVESASPVWGPCDQFVILTMRSRANRLPNLFVTDLNTNEFFQITSERGGNADWWWDEDDIDCEPFDLEQGETP